MIVFRAGPLVQLKLSSTPKYVFHLRLNMFSTCPVLLGQSQEVQGYLADTKTPPPQEFHRALGIVLLQGPKGARFLMSKVPLYLLALPRDLW